MIIFNVKDVSIEKVINFNEFPNHRIFNISINNKALEDTNLLEEMRDFLEPFLYQEDKCIICMDSLDEAFRNNSYIEDERTKMIQLALFRGLLNQFISIGHEVLIIGNRNLIDDDIVELDEIQGVELLDDYEAIKNYIRINTM